MKSWIWTAGLVAGFGLSTIAQNWLDTQPRTTPPPEERLYFSSGEAIRRASLGFNGVLADLYWIRAIQYFGSALEQQRTQGGAIDWSRMQLLAPLLEITTELDPHHIAAYRFGAFFLSDVDPEKAIGLARRGINNNPDEWRLYQDLGFIYWRKGRYREASEAYLNGSRISGAPDWMDAMAAMMLARGGDRETARQILRRLCEGSNDQFIREICDEQFNDNPNIK